MRKIFYVLFPVVWFFIFSSCNKGEGLGGSSSIDGYVYSIVHQSDNYSFTADTVSAVGERVYIIYSGNEDDPVASKDVRTNLNGMYHFEYLRKGNYTVYALSEYPEALNKEKVAEIQHVKVGSGSAKADPIYIHSGKGYGLSMVKGTVMAVYYDRSLRPVKGEDGRDTVPAVEQRVYLKRLGDITHCDDVRVGDQGVFIFNKVTPGEYEVYTTTEEVGARNRTLPTESQKIEVVDPHKIYALPEDFVVTININT